MLRGGCIFRQQAICRLFNSVYRITIRECSVTKEAIRPQNDFNRFVRRKSGVNNELVLSQESQAKLVSFFAHHPLSQKERNGQLLVGIDGDAADRIAVCDEESREDSMVERQSLIPKPPADDSPYREIRENLPIFNQRQTILDLIEANQVIILSGATGKYHKFGLDVLDFRVIVFFRCRFWQNHAGTPIYPGGLCG